MKLAVITGASSGIGREFALSLKNELETFILIGRDKDRLEKLSEELRADSAERKPDIITLSLDLSKAGFEKTVLKELARMDNPEIAYLVNSAGVGYKGSVEELPLESALSTIDLNIRALTVMCKVMIPFMKPGSVIFNISSSASFMALGGFNVYSASKVYVNYFSTALRAELKEQQIKVCAVCPGSVDTGFGKESRKYTGKIKKAFTSRARADLVVKKALKDGLNGKRFSVYSLPNRFFMALCRFLPKGWFARFTYTSVYK